MILREWQRADNEAVSQIERRCFSDAWTKEMFDECFDTAPFLGLIAEDNGEIAGYVCAAFAFEEADILNLCVDIPMRRKGYAKELMNSVIAALKLKKVERVFLEVRVSNSPAIALYERLGFQLIGTRKKYYEDTEDAYVYRLTIVK